MMKNRRLDVATNKQVSCHIAVGATNLGQMTQSLMTIYSNTPLIFHFFIHSFINFSFVSMMKNSRLGVAANEQVSCHIVFGTTHFGQMAHSPMTIYSKYTSNFSFFHSFILKFFIRLNDEKQKT
jgi:hypothetical protein